MQKLTKRLFALLLASVMVVGLLPVSAFAARVAEGVTAEVPMGEDAGEPALLAAADSLTISGYTRVTSLPEGGLDDGYYLFIAPYNGNYYMLYPGATGGGENVTNSARLVVDANGAATGYKVGAGTSYDSATVSTDFSAADNLVSPRGESNGNGALYAATAVVQGGTTYYLCKKGQSGGTGAIYQTNCESAFTVHPLSGDSAGYFNLKHEQNSFVLFYVNDMNFNQLGSIGSHGGSFMIFKSNTKEPPLPTAQLQALINEANGLTQADYTPKTWVTLQTALTAASSAVNGSDRQAMKNAMDALTAAKNGLQAKPTVPTPPAATFTYPEATADAFEEGVYTVLGQGTGRTVILHNSGDRTDQSQKGPSNSQLAPTDNSELWRITKVTDANTPDGACAVTIQGVLNNKYITSVDGTSNQRALRDSDETFYITKTTGNTYEIKNSAGQYFSFLTNDHWGMSSAGTVKLYKQTTTAPKTAEELRPEGGTTQGQPFPGEGLAGGDYFRIPTIVTVKGHTDASLNGTLVAATDIRWKSHLDSSNIDTAVSWSSDNGATWHYSFVNFFGDTGLSVTANKSALFIDPILTADNSGNLYLMVNACPAGVATHSTSYQRPEETTGFVEIDGVSRMTVYTSPENSAQDDNNYSYYIGDFASISGSTTQYAPILDAFDGSESGFYTDDHFNLYQKSGESAVPANDVIYCRQMGEGNATTDTWVQQNLFYYNATLHVRNAQFLYMVKSTDGGRTWSTPTILNGQVRTGEHIFYGPGPGAGICLDDGTIIIPTYTINERSSFIYSNDDGGSWNRGPTLSWESTENMIVQIDANTIRQFYRNRNHNLYYADYTRSNGVWTPSDAAVFTGQQKQGNNQISALRYTGKIDGKDIIFVSTASNTSASASGYARKGGKVIAFSLNEDNTMTYLSTYRINQPTDWYGYSSLTQLTNGDLGIIYENSQTDGNDTNSPGYCGLTYLSISPYTILLPGLVDRAEGLNEADYTAETWSGLAGPLATAKAVLDGTNSDTTVEAAYTGLNNALKALKKVEVTISGTVTASSAPVAGAVVTLENDQYAPVGLTATTNANGEFTFDNNNDADVTLSSAAAYKLKVQVPGYDYKVTTVNAAAFNGQKRSDTTITLEAQPEPTYTNDFNTGDISMLEGATGDAATATLTVVDHNGSKAVKISGLVGGDTPIHVLDKNAHKLRNGVVAMDITPLNTNDSHRFGFALRADGAGKRVWVGHFEGNSTDWNFQSYDGGWGDIGSSGPAMMTQNATRHVEVEMDGTTLKLWVDGVHVGTQTNLNIRNVLGYVGVSSIRSSAQFIIDNIYVRRTDPKFAVTLTATGGTLTGKVIADGVESPLASGGTVYEGDTVVITGTGDTGKCLGSITLSDTSVEVTKTPVEGGGYSFSFVMPDHAVTVTGNFKTAVTGANITGRGVVAKDLTATALAGGTEIPAGGATYKWFHQESSGTWTPCTAGEAQTKNVKAEDQGKKVKVRVEGTGDYAGWAEVATDEVIGPADVETTAVTITRDSITMWKNLDTDPDNTVNSVEGKTTTVTATVDPDSATNKTIVWTSSNAAVATVDQNGLVTAVGNGTATITATVTSANGAEVSDTVAITVKTGITDITLTKGGDTLTSASVLTIYANDGDANKSVTVNAAVNGGADAAALVWSCGHDGEDHIFHLGPTDSAAGEATGGTVAITAYDSHTLVGEETVTVSAPAATGNTAAAVSFKVKVVHKLDTTEHSVSIAGTPKLNSELSVNLTNVPSTVSSDKLNYEWKRTKDGTETSVGTGATYTPTTADDVGGTITVTVTAKENSYYEGSLTSAATAAVEKMDAPATPALSPTKPEVGQEYGYITITNYNSEYTYQIKSGAGDWEEATVTSEGKIEDLAPGAYSVKIVGTATQKESAAGTTNISDANAVEYAITATQPTEGAAISVTDKAAKDTEVTITLTVAEGYEVTAVKVNDSSDGVTKGKDNTWTFTMPDEDVTVTVEVSGKRVTVTLELSNLTATCNVGGEEENATSHTVDYGAVTRITLTAAEGYDLPSSIQVNATDGGGDLMTGTDSVTYSGGVITFPNGVTQNITITATATPKTFTASFDPATGGNLTRAVTSATPIAYNDTLTATLTPAEGYSAPDKASVEVTVGGTEAAFDYSVNATTGVATVTVANVKGNVVIKAQEAVKNTTVMTAASISGAPAEGNTLSITGVIPTGATYSVSWQKADTQGGTYATIATTDTYQLTASDAGKYFKAVVSGTGDYSGTVITAAVGPVTEKVVPATSVTIAAPQGSDGTVVVGSTLQLTATVAPTNATVNAVKWSSSNTSVATVDEDTGEVTPVKVGAASILATVINSDGSEGVTDSVEITVAPAPIALRLTGSAVENETLTAELTPAGAIGSVRLFWYRVGGSEDLLLDNNDQTTYTLTADDIGYRIKVTASVPSNSESNYTGSAEATTPTEVVAVGDEVSVEGVSLDKSTASVAVGKTMTLTATVLPANATNQTVSWVSGNEPVATVDQNGVVTGVTEGTAEITVRTTNGNFTATCIVTVTAATDPGPAPVPPSISVPSTPSTSTTTNPDGSTTTTVTDNKTGTVTETTKKPDGTVETVETKKDGTKTETTEKPDGTVEVVETKKDGTVTETTEKPDGTTEVVETKPDGTVTETNTDAEGGKVEKVTTPEKDVAITVTDAEGEVLAKVELPAEIPAVETRFVDVPVNHWADEAIHNMAALEVVEGVGNDRFDMNSSMTRGALATVLSRMSDGQKGIESSFADVASDKWYADGIAWAARTGVVTGYSATEFGPNDPITREQLAVMLCRYARLLGMDTAADSSALNGFKDGSSTHSWAADSIAWCVDKGILKGMGNSTLAPTATATRAQVSVMLQRFIDLLQK